MPKRSQLEVPLPPTNLATFLEAQDPAHLIGAVNSFETSEGWTLLKAFLDYQAASYARYSIGLAQKTGCALEASSAAAKAEILNEIQEQFLTQLRSKISGDEGLINGSVPQE